MLSLSLLLSPYCLPLIAPWMCRDEICVCLQKWCTWRCWWVSTWQWFMLLCSQLLFRLLLAQIQNHFPNPIWSLVLLVSYDLVGICIHQLSRSLQKSIDGPIYKRGTGLVLHVPLMKSFPYASHTNLERWSNGNEAAHECIYLQSVWTWLTYPSPYYPTRLFFSNCCGSGSCIHVSTNL